MVYTDYDAMLADPDVALLAEGVDRNFLAMLCLPPPLRSPSSRRAWIEIKNLLTKEEIYGSRPPRGGRG